MTQTTQLPDSVQPWFPAWRWNPRSRLRLFCFPYAGGGSLVFRSWRDSIPEEVDLCPVQLPGRENRMREPAFRSLAPLVEELAEVIPPLLDLPFAFLGHSMGALVGFELARCLRRKGVREPRHLIVSGASAPHLDRIEPPVHHLEDDALIERMRSMKGTREEVFENKGLIQLLLPLIRADFAVWETYVFRQQPPLNCPITAFGGADDEYASPERLTEWKIHTTASFRMEILPGDHFFLEKHRPMLLQRVRQLLHRTLHESSR